MLAADLGYGVLHQDALRDLDRNDARGDVVVAHVDLAHDPRLEKHGLDLCRRHAARNGHEHDFRIILGIAGNHIGVVTKAFVGSRCVLPICQGGILGLLRNVF